MTEQLDNMQLADCRKKCITKFGWCRGSQGRRRGALCVGQSWDKSRGPGSLETLSQWAFPWEAQAGRNLLAFLLLSWATEILPAGHAPPVLDSQSLVQLTIFWIQILIIIVFSYSVSLFFPKASKGASKLENQPKNKRTSLSKPYWPADLIPSSSGPAPWAAFGGIWEPGTCASFICNKVITHHSGQMQHNWWCEWMEKISCQRKKVNRGHITPGSLIPG